MDRMKLVTVIEIVKRDFPEDGPEHLLVAPDLPTDDVDREIREIQRICPTMIVIDREDGYFRESEDGPELSWTCWPAFIPSEYLNTVEGD